MTIFCHTFSTGIQLTLTINDGKVTRNYLCNLVKQCMLGKYISKHGKSSKQNQYFETHCIKVFRLN